jgi:hypothetical protein
MRMDQESSGLWSTAQMVCRLPGVLRRLALMSAERNGGLRCVPGDTRSRQHGT